MKNASQRIMARIWPRLPPSALIVLSSAVRSSTRTVRIVVMPNAATRRAIRSSTVVMAKVSSKILSTAERRALPGIMVKRSPKRSTSSS